MFSRETLLVIFAGILAFAVLTQSLYFLGIFLTIRKLNAWLNATGNDLRNKVDVISGKLDQTLAIVGEIGKSVKPIAARVAETTEIIHRRVTEVDAFVAETTSTARLEILRVQARIESISRQAEEMLESVRTSILAPINEINAITRGIRVGMDVLFRRRKYPAGTSAQDDEMFI
jgi:methyl-accepting chemotaxis protein